MTQKYFERKQKYLLFKLNKDLNLQIKALKSAFNEFKDKGNASSLCFRKMIWLTVFLKRYVNLFLICQSGESVTMDEINLCFGSFWKKLNGFPVSELLNYVKDVERSFLKRHFLSVSFGFFYLNGQGICLSLYR